MSIFKALLRYILALIGYAPTTGTVDERLGKQESENAALRKYIETEQRVSAAPIVSVRDDPDNVGPADRRTD